MCWSFVDCAWCTMVCTITKNNLSNLTKVKLIKVLNNLDVVLILVNTFKTLTPKSTNWLTALTNSLALNMQDELVITMTTIKTYCLFLLTFSNITYINLSSLEDEKLQLSSIQLKPWLEDKPMISKWKNSSTNEKWKIKVNELDALTYIIHAHQTKLLV